MAKVTFTKLALKKKEEVKNIKINNIDIEVKQYLPVNDKLNLIARVISGAHDQNNFPNPIKIEVIGAIEIILAYTNITFTDKQKEDIAKLYDILDSNGIINQVVAAIPEDEYNFLIHGIDDTIDAVYTYQNSILGILDTVSQDYSNLNLDATEIQKKLADKDNLALVREVLTKLG